MKPRATGKKVCLECNKEFEFKYSNETEFQRRKFCSLQCSNSYFYSQVNVKCDECKKEIKIFSKDLAKLHHFCNRQCYSSYRRGKVFTKGETLRKSLTLESRQKIVTTKIRHTNAIKQHIKELQEQGFKVFEPDRKPRPDIIASKDGKIYAIEVEFGTPNYNKYNNTTFFDDIIWIYKKGEKK